LNKALIIATTLGALVMASGCGDSVATTDSVVVIETVVPIETTTTQLLVLPADLGTYTSGIGCTNYEPDPALVRFVAEWGYCMFEDVNVVLYAFASQQDRDTFLELLLSVGGLEEDIVTQGLVVFVPDSAAKIEPLKRALGM
jgi:hypothetical protein